MTCAMTNAKFSSVAMAESAAEIGWHVAVRMPEPVRMVVVVMVVVVVMIVCHVTLYGRGQGRYTITRRVKSRYLSAFIL